MTLRKPNFLILGAQKAGSTWIYDVLRKHEKVFLPKRVELVFFNTKDCGVPENVAAYLETSPTPRMSMSGSGRKHLDTSGAARRNDTRISRRSTTILRYQNLWQVF